MEARFLAGVAESARFVYNLAIAISSIRVRISVKSRHLSLLAATASLLGFPQFPARSPRSRPATGGFQRLRPRSRNRRRNFPCHQGIRRLAGIRDDAAAIMPVLRGNCRATRENRGDMRNDDRPRNYRPDTLLTHLGRNPEAQHGAINPPVYHASTILSKNMAEWESRPDPKAQFGIVRYGLSGHADDLCARGTAGEDRGRLPRRDRVVRAGRGHRAAAGLRQRRRPRADGQFGAMARRAISATSVLTRCGVETTYYDPLIGDGIERLMRPNTRVVYVESPGSLTFEVQDVPAIAAVAHRYGARVLMDNTWATPYLFRSFEHGVDVSIHAATKYIGGHSDIMLGAVDDQRGKLAAGALDDRPISAIAPGRTTSFRVARHAHLERAAGAPPEERAGGRALAADKAGSVARALPGFARRPRPRAVEARFSRRQRAVRRRAESRCRRKRSRPLIDSLDLFGIGASWGGYESLIQPSFPERSRTATRWQAEGPLVRIHIGLEDPQDLIADLAQGLDKLRAAAA